MAKNKKRYCVNTIDAESWDGKNGAPNLHTQSNRFDTVEDARFFVQKEIGRILINSENKIEWINWLPTYVEIKFNYNNDGAGNIHQNRMMEILEVNEESHCKMIEIGS